VVANALEQGMRLAKMPEASDDLRVQVLLGKADGKKVNELCDLLGLSAKAVLNAAIHWTLYVAKRQRVDPKKLKVFPKRLTGERVDFDLSLETAALARHQRVTAELPACTVAGIKLLHKALTSAVQRKPA
jgi:hypothetical protein